MGAGGRDGAKSFYFDMQDENSSLRNLTFCEGRYISLCHPDLHCLQGPVFLRIIRNLF